MPALGPIGMSNVGRFLEAPIPRTSRYLISGVTKDANGNALGGCAVDVFETVSKLWRGATISDATGNYAIEITGDRGLTFFVNTYLAGSPDVAGTTINTLVGA